MLLDTLAAASQHIRFEDLHLSKVALDLKFFEIKWYSLAYIAGILVGWWYLLKMLGAPGAPMSRRHADDLVFYATIGIIAGGRLGYVVFYQPEMFLNPVHIFMLWDGGMSFHGGVIGTTLAILWLCRRNGLSWLRVHDYVACCAPMGLFFGRLANFVNGELWGKPADVPWAIVFPGAGPLARHPSQLYEALLEGLVLFAILAWMFWRTSARYYPGRLVGVFLTGYGCFRFFVEYFREPDQQFIGTFFENVIHMGQLLCLPMIVGGIYLLATSAKRRERYEAMPPAGEPRPEAAPELVPEAPAAAEGAA
ncbi:prolipoprotein diacylglyceryl transferase [Sphingomonas sp.]|uniref:prolipoprotein diacylglyceryl transferase n=1 Tax=Sphingomonas sp. TaxID=28214 RepID=UPI001AFCF066|nr:prolipoprotein diacylglyceryl transferase [Sphingomonas sp.]MBO9715082.1 prolipoprotein diacylglyceryl transferase [Sphingomonas sp.]